MGMCPTLWKPSRSCNRGSRWPALSRFGDPYHCTGDRMSIFATHPLWSFTELSRRRRVVFKAHFEELIKEIWTLT